MKTIKKSSLKIFWGVASALLSLPLVTSAAGINVQWTSYIVPTNFNDLITMILEALIVLATPIVVLFIIYAGFLYVTARGNAEQVQKATQALTYAIIGGVLIIGAVAISTVIGNTVNSFKP